MPTPAIVLASTSPYRRMLLERLGIPFSVASPGVAETYIEAERAPARALRLAQEKAIAVATQQPQSLVIGCDQVASFTEGANTQMLDKPGGREACRAQLAAMAGRVVHFDTAVAVRLGNIELWHVDQTLVRFRELAPAEIETYIDREPSFDCAGGFKSEGLGVSLFHSVETRDPTGLVGLPLIGLCDALRRLGVPV